LHINSTGDGALIVFTGEWHFANAFLASILLDRELRRRCRLFAAANRGAGFPKPGFGIGVESGSVSRIVAQPPVEWARPVIDAYVGECINVAARAEGVTKLIDSASTVFSVEVVEQVANALFGENFREKTDAERLCRTDEERHQAHDSMRALARRLCLSYIHRHHLKGVTEPVPLYRLTASSLNPERPRVYELLERLTRGDADHLAEVIKHLQAVVDEAPKSIEQRP
jgi:class 3 adenylate cyclase